VTVVYPGSDAWVEIETDVVVPGADPAWVEIETPVVYPGADSWLEIEA